ncbi:MAG: quinone oxidoreductase [Phenylobacterium sp.]|jgi:NADPH2:quinone reductase|uniref:quinone oxidoreductase family protein n=1 Tax=Phenylobacterium sp. TaxID=1871053 RepID=UPI002A36B0E1|nr:quinone oxidoreductase [Phenylobacterium sp.]MDX9998209.1 quinone oxidoreductase [Phenylobacterium sp.]
MLAIRFEQTGGPEVLKTVDVPVPEPGPGQILVRHQAVGVNFIDTYHRTGLYPVKLPSGLGMEAAGVVEKVGAGVTRFAVGDPVVYSSGPLGAYAEYNVTSAERAVKPPAGIDAKVAAAVLLKGMTAEFLVRRCFPLKAGQTALVHAAAGGVGQILVQWAKHIGATVIATVGSQAKAEVARRLGADHVILYGEQDVPTEVRTITGGRGVEVAYDSVGAATFEGTLASLARRGMFVSYGNASGPAPAVEPLRLQRAGSVFLTRPTLFDYTATQAELDDSAGALFDLITKGIIKVEVGQTFPLAQAADAHRALESRATVGATVLIP